MFSVWQSVQVKNPEHARTGQAGTVFAVNGNQPAEVAVKYDLDGIIEVADVADLKGL